VRKLVRLGALLDAGSVALWLETEGSPEFLDNLRSCVKEVAADYRLPEKDQKWPVPGQDWFYLRHGALATPSKYDESAHVAFEGHQLEVKLEIETNTTDEPPPGLFERFTQTMAKAVGNAVAGVSPVRKGKRKVAGLAGEELLIRDSEGGKLSFLWSFPGEQGSAKHPEINIVMDTSDGELDQKTALWESLLDSMRPVAP
jgi:hypothetical protein